MREAITEIMAKVTPVLLLAGVAKSSANVLPKKYDAEIDPKYFMHALKYLHDMEPVVNEFNRVYKLSTPEQWELYTAMGVTDLREQLMLTAITKKILKLWSKRPVLLTRKGVPHAKPKVKKADDSDSES